ncbi:MAG: hypothetical protein AABZ30_07215, partial [Myxococcota bacterium]
ERARRARGAAGGADGRLAVGEARAQSEWLFGARTDAGPRGAARTWQGATALASYSLALGADVAIEPALMAEWLDADREEKVGARFVWTGAIDIDFGESVRLLLELERTEVEARTPRLDDAAIEDIDATAAIGQLQLRL